MKPNPGGDLRPQSSWLIGFHWATLALILIGVAAVLGREWIDDKLLRLCLIQLHRGSGLLVMMLTLVRLPLSPWLKDRVVETTQLMRYAASATHWLLYGLLLAIPAVGWALSSAHGQDLSFLGLIPLPPLVARDRDLADQLQQIHEALAIAMLCIALIHASAALWHHYVRRDAVLMSMLPRRRGSIENP
ncbi:MAG: cybB [Hydrocarboniphaga sp.]|uniref:cytochrome b n=1 Tax=Hydrocarboniphaga sp. TaxID=2033016 RepID=UPI00262CFD5F|nr:cytochrome b [Hydrocarboniphaga sp.]MDB5972553.1 cybB [Hydrocarboniphaga sp.]